MLNELLTSNSLLQDARRAVSSGPLMLVNLSAVQRNFKRLSSMTAGQCAAIVKGDGYGHGMIESAKALQRVGAQLFFTARFEDALVLRKALGASAAISVLDGVPEDYITEALDQDIVPVINSLEQLIAIWKVGRLEGKRIPAFVHLDTAMNRLGLAPKDDGKAHEYLGCVDVQAYMTHFASADDVDLALCSRQTQRLRERVKQLPLAPLSIANSCGVFLGTEYHGEIVRPGKSTFGINPLFEGENPMSEPATVFAPVVQIRELAMGEPIGYSCTWHAPAPRRIAILAIGYANGYHRTNSNVGYVTIDGKKAPVVGRVSMDLTAVDVSGIPNVGVNIGTLAEVLGPSVSYRQLAEAFGTNEHEAIIALGKGCKRIHHFEGRDG